MTIHKRTRLTPLDRQEIWRLYGTRQWTVVALAQQFRVSRPTIYKVIDRARKQEFAPRTSTNKRFLQARYGMKRLAKVERTLERKQKLTARRYNKSYPGEMDRLVQVFVKEHPDHYEARLLATDFYIQTQNYDKAYEHGLSMRKGIVEKIAGEGLSPQEWAQKIIAQQYIPLTKKPLL